MARGGVIAVAEECGFELPEERFDLAALRSAEEVFLTVDAVKAHLRVLFERYGLSQLPQNEKRARLVAIVLDAGALAPRDFSGLLGAA